MNPAESFKKPEESSICLVEVRVRLAQPPRVHCLILYYCSSVCQVWKHCAVVHLTSALPPSIYYVLSVALPSCTSNRRSSRTDAINYICDNRSRLITEHRLYKAIKSADLLFAAVPKYAVLHSRSSTLCCIRNSTLSHQ